MIVHSAAIHTARELAEFLSECLAFAKAEPTLEAQNADLGEIYLETTTHMQLVKEVLSDGSCVFNIR